jgi:siroheme synthase-like protein
VRLLSVNLNFTDRWALVLGAGAVGRRKLAALLEAGAKVRVVEPNPGPWLLELAAEGLILLEKTFEPRFLEGNPWVFLAAKVDESLRPVLDLIKAKDLWVNVASSPEESNFFPPALVSDEPFRLTVSTGGTSPALAALVAESLRRSYEGYGALCRLLGQARRVVLSSSLEEKDRRLLLTSLARDASLRELLKKGDYPALKERLNDLLAPLSWPEDYHF